jgi:hypothetical protein
MHIPHLLFLGKMAREIEEVDIAAGNTVLINLYSTRAVSVNSLE